jgi:membrane protease YdiL (CAAX protease family)
VCGEAALPQFSHCWSCGAALKEGMEGLDPVKMGEDSPRKDHETDWMAQAYAATEAPAAPLGYRVWLEVLVVVLYAVVPLAADSIRDVLRTEVPRTNVRRNPTAADLADLIWSLQVVPPLLYIMLRSGRPWAHFGFTKPEWLADSMLLIVFFCVDLGSIILEAPFSRLFPYREIAWTSPLGLNEHLLSAAAIIASAFTQELLFRSYLIPRLEEWLGSTAWAILVSSLFFASMHIYQGSGGVAATLLNGLLFGAAFAITRRIWPLVAAHALWNLYVYW